MIEKEINKEVIEALNYKDLTDRELIDTYNTIRDQQEQIADHTYFPNLKYLYATPFEREKDRREQKNFVEQNNLPQDIIDWYSRAKDESCIWWIENHVIARHSLSRCISCGCCTAMCPAAELYDFVPRNIMEIVQEKDEESIIELLKSDTIWYCHQCGSCKPKCPQNNSPFGLISSLRQLSQIKGYHLNSVRGRQQYAARHMWGGNLWNRACTIYFRGLQPEAHRDFGPHFEQINSQLEELYLQIGAHPDREGHLSGRKVHAKTLEELRKLVATGGGLFFWQCLEGHAAEDCRNEGIDLEEYHDKVRREG